MLKQVLVIGLGEKTDALLHRLTEKFDVESAAFSATWVVPRVPETVLDKVPDAFPLPLTADALNELYYQQELRKWCAPNWKTWGKAIISNRLHGTLAGYYHLQQLYKHIESLINDFGQERKSLQIYLVAHAHDPFASGAFVHLAYLLNEQAVKSGYQVYGCVILPDIINDPIRAAHGDSVHDGRLHYATAYALFKELHFVVGRDSFYKNHHPDVNIDLQNESPFQTGDCYLFGGSVDENGQPLTYENVVEQIATYIYDNARTPLADKIINTPPGQSTFTSVRTLRRTADEQQQNNYELDALLAVILRRLMTNHGKSTISLNSYLSPNFMMMTNTRFQEAQMRFNESYSNIGLTADVNRTDDAHHGRQQTLNELEALYTDATKKLYEYVALMESAGDILMRKAIKELHPDTPRSPLFAVRNEPSTSFADLEELYNGVLTTLLREIDNVQLVFDARRQESLMAAERLRIYRVRVMYSLQIGRSPLFMLFMLGIVLGVAYAILVANLLVQTLIWTAISVVTLPTMVVYYGQRRQEQAERQLVEHQRTTITLQRELATLRVTLNYLRGLYDALEHELVETRPKSVDDDGDAVQDVTYVGQILEKLEENRVEVERRRSQAEENASAEEPIIADPVWAEVSVRILDAFWTQARSEKGLTSKEVQTYLERQVNDRNLASVNRHENDLIQTMLEDSLKIAAPLLATKTTHISEDHQEALRYYIRFVNWHETTTEDPELTKYLLSKRIEPITMQNYSKQKQLVITAVRTNVPLRAVQEFERYRDAYCKVIQMRRLDDFHNYRAHMHPTRWGVAAPSPEIYMMSQVAKIPHFVMMIVTIMHLAENMHIITTLCDRLHLYYESTKPSSVNYDELCGGLQDDHSEVQRLVNEARSAGAPDSGSFAAFIEYMSGKVLHTSEVYADWEVWAVEQLKRQYRSQQNIPLWNQLITYLAGTETLGD